jgi:PPE-repeat protein
MDSKEIQQFIDKIVEEKGLATLDPEVVAQIKTDLSNDMNAMITARLVEQLPEGKQKELDQMLDNNATDSEIQTFMSKNIPNIEHIVSAALIEFKTLYSSK